MEQWNDGPPWCYPVLTASSGIISWIAVKKLTSYEFGLGQGILGLLVFHLVENLYGSWDLPAIALDTLPLIWELLLFQTINSSK